MATKAKTTKNQVQGMLLEGSFGEHTETPLALSDPVTTTQMVLKLAEIKAYDKNPRKEKNPLYNEIKASILSNKRLNNNFNITRRPGDDLFMIESGGNTRLQILNELYSETGDEAFNRVQCLFVPWSSESNILTSHLIENEMRGDMMLIDRAYAIKNLKDEMEAELGKNLSRNEFSKFMIEKGYKISTRNLSRLNYAIELDQMIPQVLRRGTGISGSKLDEIKKIHQTYCDYCTDKTDRFDLIFMGVMTEHNENEEFNLKDVRADIDEQLAIEIEIQSNHIFLEIQSRLVNAIPTRIEDISNDTISPPTFSPEEEQQQQSGIDQKITETAQENENIDNKISAAAKIEPDKKEKTNTLPNQDSSTLQPTILNQEKDDDISLANLRLKNYELICDIARPFTLEDVIHQIDNGLGFIIECPQKRFDFTGPNEIEEKIKYMVWWYLLVMSEQNMDARRFYIWRHLELFALYHDQERGGDSLVNHVKTPPESRTTLGLIQNPDVFSDKGFLQCFRLMENVRRLKKHHTEKMIWGYKE